MIVPGLDLGARKGKGAFCSRFTHWAPFNSCKICSHPKREELDQDFMGNKAVRGMRLQMRKRGHPTLPVASKGARERVPLLGI